MGLPAGLSNLHPWATAQSKTVSMRCLTRLAVSDLLVHIGVRMVRNIAAVDLVHTLGADHGMGRRWPGCSSTGPRAWRCSRWAGGARSRGKRLRQMWEWRGWTYGWYPRDSRFSSTGSRPSATAVRLSWAMDRALPRLIAGYAPKTYVPAPSGNYDTLHPGLGA